MPVTPDVSSVSRKTSRRAWPVVVGVASILVSAAPWAALFVIYVMGVGWDLTVVSRLVIGFIVAGIVLSLLAAAKGPRLWLIVTTVDAALLAFVFAFLSDLHEVLKRALMLWRG
jgi:hypothetical protein